MDEGAESVESESDTSSSYSDDAADICTICQGYLDCEGQHTCTLAGCGHRFHSECIVHALQYNRACPNCRYAPSNEVNNIDDDAETEEAVDEEAYAEQQRRAQRRMSAIRSTLARARFGRVAPEVHKIIKRYRSFGTKVDTTLSEHKHTAQMRRKCRQTFRGIFEREYKRYERQDRRIVTQLRSIDARLQCVEAQKASLGDMLASAGGFCEDNEAS